MAETIDGQKKKKTPLTVIINHQERIESEGMREAVFGLRIRRFRAQRNKRGGTPQPIGWYSHHHIF